MIICYEILTSETNSLKNFKDLDIFRLPELLNTVYLLFKKVQSIKAEKNTIYVLQTQGNPVKLGLVLLKESFLWVIIPMVLLSVGHSAD